MKSRLSIVALAALILASSGFATDTPGTINFPGSKDSVVSLFEVANNAATTLTSAVLIGDTSMSVVSTAGYPSTGVISIDNEAMYYAGTTATTFTGLTRGVDGTAAAAHSNGRPVQGRYIARHHSVLRDTLILIEAKLGTGSATPANGQFLAGNGAGTSTWRALASGDIPNNAANTTGDASTASASDHSIAACGTSNWASALSTTWALTCSQPAFADISGTASTGQIPNLDASKITSGTFAEARGGTSQSTYTLGDTLYASAANTLSKLAGNTISTRKFLRQTGTGTVSAAPVWDTLVSGDIPNNAANTTGNASTATASDHALATCAGNNWMQGFSNSAWALSCAQLSAANLSNGTSGTGAVVLAASPTLSGNVGIGGAANASAALHVFGVPVFQLGAGGSAPSFGAGNVAVWNTAANSGVDTFRDDAAGANLSAGELIGFFGYQARFNSTWNRVARIDGYYTGNGTTQLGDIAFLTANGGAAAERARINAAGDFGIENSTLANFVIGALISNGDNTCSRLTKNPSTFDLNLYVSDHLSVPASAFKIFTFKGATNPAFALSSAGIVSLLNPLPEASGGTNQSTYTLGDTLYASAANTLAKLAGNTTGTRRFLRQTGTGTVSAAPAWDTLVSGDIPNNAANTTGNASTASGSDHSITSCGASNWVTGLSTAWALTCSQPSASSLTNGATGSGAVVLQNTPTIYKPTLGVVDGTLSGGSHITIAGSTPTCTFSAGGGTSPSCSVVGTDAAGIITLTTGSGSPSSSGSVTLTFTVPYSTNPPIMLLTLVKGSGTWSASAVAMVVSESTSAPGISWSNQTATGLVALSAATTYKISYLAFQR